MRRVLIVLGVIAVLAVGGWYGYTRYQAKQDEAAAEAAAAASSSSDLENVIWASGKLEPVTWAELSPVNPGVVNEILVVEGDWVEEGDLLLALDNGVLESQLQAAQAQLAEAQAALDKLKAGATDADIAAAQAELDAAEAGVALAAGRMMEVQAAIDAAETQVTTARRQYAELASHPTAAERQAAAAEVAIAEANVRTAQAAYNLVKGDPNVGALPQAQALASATAALEAAKAKRALTNGGPTPQQLAVAQSAIDAARVQVVAAQASAPGAEANVQAAMARRDAAQAALDKLLAGATAEDLAMAEARVTAAQAAAAAVQAQIELGQVSAPFAGEIGQINARVGAPTTPGVPALLLGDTRQMYVKTTDLRETDVVHLSLDMPVEVTFDALPDALFNGRITRIAPVSNTEKGGVNYTVHVDADDLDPRLRWGMTAFVNIRVDR